MRTGILSLVLVMGLGLGLGQSAEAARKSGDSVEAATSYLVMLDASAAMALPFGATTRLEAATRVLNEVLSQSTRPGQIELLTYGYSEQTQCKDFLMDAPIRADRMDLLDAQLKCVVPRAKLPVDMLIEQQVARLESGKAIGRIVVVSGGLEKHRASVCIDSQVAAEHHTQVEILVVDEREDAEVPAALKCVAARYGGKARLVSTESLLARAILESVRVEGLSMLSLTAALPGGDALVDADLSWRLVRLDMDGMPTTEEVSFRGAAPVETLEPGKYRVSVKGEGVEGGSDVVLLGGRHHSIALPLECRTGYHPNRGKGATGCLSDFDFGSCGSAREDCREIAKDNGIVGCDGKRCTLACDDDYHVDVPETPRACLADTTLASCGLARIDCSIISVDKADVGCDGTACTVTCQPGLYQHMTDSGTVCLDNHAYCAESAERFERSWIAAASGGAAGLGAGLLFWSQRGRAFDLNEEVGAYKEGDRRPAATFLDLEDRGKSIATLDTASAVFMALSAAAGAYAGYEWAMQPSPTTYSCAGPMTIRQAHDEPEPEQPPAQEESPPDEAGPPAEAEPADTGVMGMVWPGFELSLGDWLSEVLR